MRPKHVFLALSGAGLLAVLVAGLLQLGGASQAPSSRSTLTLAQMRDRLAGSPAPLEALHARASQLLPGGIRALRARLATLRGQPVVINKWASWCEPCRQEFAAFQRAALSLGREVAFVGIDSGDYSRADALDFLRSFPVSYPSYYDHNGQAGLAITDSTFTPVTVFYNRNGSQYIHQGPYPTQAKLEQDVLRYALNNTSGS
jgi:cytochrome c biogenesis protein CcmG, thiol:disulfide interchange protein DsbE